MPAARADTALPVSEVGSPGGIVSAVVVDPHLNQIVPLDLSSGDGPALTRCLVDTLRQMLGADTSYLGQAGNGSARLKQGGSIFSFYPLRASGDNSQTLGIHLLASNALNIGTACGNLDVAPALYNPAEFGMALTALGLSAQTDATGVITIAGNGNTYAVRPDYVVEPGRGSGTKTLKSTCTVWMQCADGRYRFVDSLGNSQELHPAFLLPSVLRDQAAVTLGGQLVIQTDGTAVLTRLDHTQSVFQADWALGPIPPSFASFGWWGDGPDRFRVAVGFLSQGMTLIAQSFGID